ncbi:hypothetical protein PTKIN_Ptkin03bG0143700 [Pterospermum kingtungense]
MRCSLHLSISIHHSLLPLFCHASSPLFVASFSITLFVVIGIFSFLQVEMRSMDELTRILAVEAATRSESKIPTSASPSHRWIGLQQMIIEIVAVLFTCLRIQH